MGTALNSALAAIPFVTAPRQTGNPVRGFAEPDSTTFWQFHLRPNNHGLQAAGGPRVFNRLLLFTLPPCNKLDTDPYLP